MMPIRIGSKEVVYGNQHQQTYQVEVQFEQFGKTTM
jgi:hypothetical protein